MQTKCSRFICVLMFHLMMISTIRIPNRHKIVNLRRCWHEKLLNSYTFRIPAALLRRKEIKCINEERTHCTMCVHCAWAVRLRYLIPSESRFFPFLSHQSTWIRKKSIKLPISLDCVSNIFSSLLFASFVNRHIFCVSFTNR